MRRGPHGADYQMCECGECPKCKHRERTRAARTAKRSMANAKAVPLEFPHIRLTLTALDIYGQFGAAHGDGYGEL